MFGVGRGNSEVFQFIARLMRSMIQCYNRWMDGAGFSQKHPDKKNSVDWYDMASRYFIQKYRGMSANNG